MHFQIFVGTPYIVNYKQNAYTLFCSGSQGPGCNNEGRCTCKLGVYGDKCDRCRGDTPVTASGCEPLR